MNFILDKSGSMEIMRDAVRVDSMNTLITCVNKKESLFSFTLFDSKEEIEQRYIAEPIKLSSLDKGTRLFQVQPPRCMMLFVYG